MSTPITPLSDTLAVAPQLGAEDMAAVKSAGYHSVIINRPDYEGGESQPASADVIKAGEQAGLTVVYQPVVSGAITPEDVKTFRQHLDTLPTPVLAYCRSGTRCTHLYNAAKQETSQS
ncbi:TIGR01244 family protein [Advenella sp. S44]|uniref:TIGR01244 family sulfur transferase n=1 Tax=Advenella sp. S44 TaxID=1982755 RepID=UPI000C2A40F4|nr:TIGR01244 family sulfur transferase [Advenella sp. S44]PJX25835.1 TIGR01244 family protein [Advenella sp. S44]